MNIHENKFEPKTKNMPKAWPRFELDEIISIKGYDFKVVLIGEKELKLKPVQPTPNGPITEHLKNLQIFPERSRALNKQHYQHFQPDR